MSDYQKKLKTLKNEFTSLQRQYQNKLKKENKQEKLEKPLEKVWLVEEELLEQKHKKLEKWLVVKKDKPLKFIHLVKHLKII
jgi:hypothetical protein